jgi:hypothetical protein
MITFLSWWFVASIVATGINYVLMQFTDDDDD